MPTYVTPTQRTSPAPGEDDPRAAALEVVRANIDALAALDGDPYARDLASAATAAHNAIEQARRLPWSVADDAQKRYEAMSGFVEAQQQAAAGAVSPFGNGSPGDYEAKAAAARSGVARSAWQTAAGSAAAGAKEKGAQLAQAVADAMAALSTAIESKADDFAGPVALRAGRVTIDDLHRQASAEQELRAMPTPCTTNLALVKRMLSRGEFDRIDALALGLRTVALEVRDMPPAKLAQRYAGAGGAGGRAGAADGEREAAFLLLRWLADYRKGRRPASIDAAAEVYDQLQDLSTEILGRAPRDLTRGERGALYSGTDTSGSALRTLPVRGDWYARHTLAAAMSGPPGWSPVVGRNEVSGATYRKTARR